MSEARKRYPFRVEPPRIGYYREENHPPPPAGIEFFVQSVRRTVWIN